jgi:dihydropyrimidine dehydrogenase (NAD+) subunit PreT
MNNQIHTLLSSASDIKANRLSARKVAENFSDLRAPLTPAEASIETDRCYFCYDAPCTIACPTGIDIPAFIQKIRTGNTLGAAQTILSENIMGGMCARVCPTEVLCEQVCVRNTHESKPVEIGLLQRYATDPVLQAQRQLFTRGAPSGRKVAVVGAGPAGLSCAHRLAMLGHQVSVLEARDKIAGLNEYGIAAYKATGDVAAQEAQYILSIGGIEVKTDIRLGVDTSLKELREQFDAVFLAAGLDDTRRLNIEAEDTPGVMDAVEYIASLRQTPDKESLPIGRRVVVIGGGMTAVDIAIQSKLLGAEDVTIVYRRSQAQMGASEHEQEMAQTQGVLIRLQAAPQRIISENGNLTGVEFERMTMNEDGSVKGRGETFELEADVVFKAIGQVMVKASPDDQMPETQGGKIVVDAARRTSLEKVWAGGDCVLDGENLTVYAVQDGKLAAISIDQYLRQKGDQ